MPRGCTTSYNAGYLKAKNCSGDIKLQNLAPGIQALMDFARQTSLKRMEQHARVDDCAIVPMERATIWEWTSQIIVAGQDVEVVFRTCFDMAQVRQLVNSRLGKDGPDHMAIDLVREYCNLVSGQIKSALETINVPMAQGLPFAVQGAGPILGEDVSSGFHAFDRWQIKTPSNISVGCTIHILIKEPRVIGKLDALSHVASEMPSSGEAELF